MVNKKGKKYIIIMKLTRENRRFNVQKKHPQKSSIAWVVVHFVLIKHSVNFKKQKVYNMSIEPRLITRSWHLL